MLYRPSTDKHSMHEIYIVFDGTKLLVYPHEKKFRLPVNGCFSTSAIKSKRYMGHIGDTPYFLLELNISEIESGEYINLRELFGLLSEDEMAACGYALQIRNWRFDNRFCGRCGVELQDKKDEQALICRGCSHIIYPRINPCIIVAVRDGNKILLARSVRFPKTGFYSVLAGFVEPGETLEDCIRREVMEEVNIRIKNIRYFGSQPWPYSGSLMVGFTADYDGGDIQLQADEIADAKWFIKDSLPEVPGWGSIAGMLINHFIDTSE